MKIGFIGGTGWIGLHLVKSLLDKGLLAADDCWVSNRSGDFAALVQYHGVHLTTDNVALCAACDVVFLCVRPQDFKALPRDLGDKLWISVMAGVTLQAMGAHLNSTRVVRTMPNAAIEVEQSVTPWLATAAVGADERALLQKWLESVGMAFAVESEDQLNYLTALSGSSHGTIAYFQRAMVQAATNFGLDPDLAKRIIYQVFVGNSELMQQQQRDPHADVALVIDYNGTTAQLCRKLNDLKVDASIEAAIAASYEKASTDLSS